MADKLISDLTASTALSGGELLEIEQGGNSKKVAIATAAEVRSKTDNRLLSSETTWDAAAWVNLGNLTGTITPDLGSFISGAYGVATGNITLGAPTDVPSGAFSFALQITQDATGGRTLSLNNTYWVASEGAAPEWDITASARNVLACLVLPDGKILVGLAGKGVA